MNKILSIILGLLIILIPIWLFSYLDAHTNFKAYDFAAFATSIIFFIIGSVIIAWPLTRD
jgi:hypothetical protein